MHEDQIRIKWRLGKVRTRTRSFFSKIPKTQTKRRFLALVKHYIINLELSNSLFSSTKLRAQTNRDSMHLTFV